MKTSLLVYLGGPMTGLTYAQITGWRAEAASRLEDAGFTILDPTRGLTSIPPGETVKDCYDKHPTESQKTVFERDKFDSTRADIVIINFLGVSRISIGTLMELAWANLRGKFTVVLMEDSLSTYDHAFVKETASVRLNNVDDAIDYIIKTFSVNQRRPSDV